MQQGLHNYLNSDGKFRLYFFTKKFFAKNKLLLPLSS